jgi:hypothetical protein
VRASALGRSERSSKEGTKVASLGVRNDLSRVSSEAQTLADQLIETELLWSGDSMVPLRGSPTAVRATGLATASAAMGWMSAGGRRTVLPSVAESAIPLTNSKN